MTGRRLLTLAVVLTVLGVPAFVLRALCVGGSCASARQTVSDAPFCSLPQEIRDGISKGFYEGRSGDVFAVAGSEPVMARGLFWPSVRREPPAVPIVFWGPGIEPDTQIARGPGLEDIAPTIAGILDLERPHPDVRSGEPIEETIAGPADIGLVLEIVWQGIGTRELRHEEDLWPNLADLFARGAGTLEATTGSLPIDPAAALTTIGTGGLPFQHGMTGSLVRDDKGRPTRPWSEPTSSSVIATLPDHLEESFAQEPVIGVVGTDVMARGLVGGEWGIKDRDLVDILPRRASVARQADHAVGLLRASALGRDEVPDVLGVVLNGDVEELDRTLPRVIAAAREASDDRVLVVVTGTGSSDPDATGPTMSADDLVADLEDDISGPPGLIEAVTPGALFLDSDELTRRGVYDDVVLKPLEDLRSPSGSRVFADVFPSAAVTFGRFC